MAFGLFGCAVLYVILSGTLIQATVHYRTEKDMDVPVYVYVIGCSVFVIKDDRRETSQLTASLILCVQGFGPSWQT